MYKKFIIALLFSFISFQAYAGEEYNQCRTQAGTDEELALCMKAETSRLMKDIQQFYINLVQNPDVKAWNKGNGLISGNLKDMYNSWLAYRNRYCSLYVAASKNVYGDDNYHRESCLIEMTDDHYKLMLAVISNSVHDMDGGH